MKTRFLMLWTVAVLATAAAFVVHLTLRFETVRLGYQVGEARRTQRELIDAQHILSLEAAALSQPDRIELVARRTLGMDVAHPNQIISLGRNATGASSRGDAR
jgi:cell division protein FtsL